MGYATADFMYSLKGGDSGESQVVIDPATIRRVIAAWGYSPGGYCSWTGGFLLERVDGSFTYLTGWCDTTGWGCQDGTEVTHFESKPQLDDLEKPPLRPSEDGTSSEWDLNPADLNKWLSEGAKSVDAW